jgi:hypothetical protein
MSSQKSNKTAKSRHHPNYFLRLWTTLSGFESLPPSQITLSISIAYGQLVRLLELWF